MAELLSGLAEGDAMSPLRTLHPRGKDRLAVTQSHVLPRPNSSEPMPKLAINGPAVPAPILRVDGLRKTYGAGVGVREVSFDVREGEIFQGVCKVDDRLGV